MKLATFLLVWVAVAFPAAAIWGGWLRNRRRDHERALHRRLLRGVIQ